MVDFKLVCEHIKRFLQNERVNVFCTYLDRDQKELEVYVDLYSSDFPKEVCGVKVDYLVVV